MFKWRALPVMAGLALLALASASVADAQEDPGGRRRRFDPEQMRERMMNSYKEMLAVNDDEWTVISPLLQKVMDVQRQTRVVGGFGFGGRRGRRGNDQPTEDAANLSPIEKAAQELRTVLENEAATADDIKAKLTAYREAREAARTELAKAQQALREVLSVRQEAQLVMRGLLD